MLLTTIAHKILDNAIRQRNEAKLWKGERQNVSILIVPFKTVIEYNKIAGF